MLVLLVNSKVAKEGGSLSDHNVAVYKLTTGNLCLRMYPHVRPLVYLSVFKMYFMLISFKQNYLLLKLKFSIILQDLTPS